MKRKKKQPLLFVGELIYEVFIYEIRKAVVTRIIPQQTFEHGVKTTNYIYEIECEDESHSPRYYESDIGKYIFTDRDSAELRLRYNLRYKAAYEGRTPYALDGK